MTLSKYDSTRETTNLARVARIILGPCTDVLRAVLKKEMLPAALLHNVKVFMANLPKYTKPPISKTQLQQVISGDYSNFDIPLLYVLLRNICSIPEHRLKWGNKPSRTDRSVSANIERIRLVRNEYYGHATHFAILDTEFINQWKELLLIVIELEAYIGSSTDLQDAVKEIKSCPMDREVEQKFIDKLLLIEELQDRIASLENTKVPFLLKDISKWKEDDKVFFETHTFSSMLEKVRSLPYVMFVGVPGSGKTATVRHIALVLQGEGYDILSIKNINDIETYCDPQNPQVFVIDDVLGKFGQDVTMYNIFKKYEDILTTPKMSKTKVLMTCRELVYRNEKLSTHFLSQERNVVLLNSTDNVLNNYDKLKILARYQIGSDVLSSDEIKSSSNMFPLLCKLFSSKPNFKDYGSTFFISPVPCILDELDKMRTESNEFYASLVLLVVNQNKLSKDILDNITNANDESNGNEKKSNILEACKVRKDLESFRIIDALSEMEKTYTRRFGSEFTFVHDSMFEIVAYHFGCQFQGLILQYMSSDYIAHYIKLKTSDSENIENEEKTCKDNKQINKSTVESSVIDLCIKLQGSLHKAFAERLYIDVENGEWYNVFGNEALKRPSVFQAFIEVMAEKPYPKLKSLFFSDMKDTTNLRHYVNQVDRFHESGGLERLIKGMLINERFSRYYETSVRAISWVIYYGHNQLLRYIIDRTIREHSNSYDLFRNLYNECKENYPDVIKRGTNNESEFIPDNVLTDEQENDTDNVSKSSGDDYMSGDQDNDTLGMLNCFLLCFGYCVTSDSHINNTSRFPLTPCAMESDEYYRKTNESDKHPNSIDDDMEVVDRNMESEIDSYIEPVIVEHNRLLCLGCYSGDITTVTTLLKHVDKHAIDITESCHRRSYWVMNPLSIACSLGYLEITKTLINIEANINHKTDIFTPLIGACENGHISVVELLIDTEADVNAVCTNKSPLTVACRQGYSDIVSTLIKRNASVNLYDGMDTPLTAACVDGHLHIVKTLIEAGAAVNLNISNCTPLTKVCYKGHLDVVQLLIEAGADVNLNDSECTPLTKACHEGHLDVVQKLIEADADVNLNDGKWTPLTIACQNGHLDVVQTLIEADADVNLNDVMRTPLTISCEREHIDVVQLIIEAGADVNLNDSECTPLTRACHKGHLDVVQKLIEADSDVNLNDGKWTPLTIACRNGHLDEVQKLIEADADVNLNDGKRTPLTIACESEHIDVVQKLIEAGADVNLNDSECTPLTRACHEGHSDVVQQLFEAGADVNLNDIECTPLTRACDEGHSEVVQKLIEAGADVNPNDGERTPLTRACRNGHLDVVQKLIEAGADVNLNHRDSTPLTRACYFGYLDVVQKLIEAGADVNLNDSECTPLTRACDEGHSVVVQKLIEAGADVNLNDGERTPLTIACRNGHLDVVQKLIEAGADVNLNHRECTPLTSACYFGHLDVVQKLIEADADVNLYHGECTPLIIACTREHLNVLQLLIEAGADVNLNHRKWTPLLQPLLKKKYF